MLRTKGFTIQLVKKGALLRNASSTQVKSLFKAVFGFIVLFAAFAISVGSIVSIGYVGMLSASLPDVTQIATRDLALSTKIYDRNHVLLYTVFGDINREYVPIEQIPNNTKWALLAAEDIDFYHHAGIDVTGMFSAVYDFLRSGELKGASTITQQLARNAVLEAIMGEDEAYDKSLKRKLLEILVAFQLETHLTKDKILELQMNGVFLGGTTYGFKTAARVFFSKDVKELTLSESAFLAGIIQAPAFYHEKIAQNQMEVVIKRRNDILDLMLKHKERTGVTEEQVSKAKEELLVLKPYQNDPKAPHFVFYVIEQLEKMYGKEKVRTGGLEVVTTLDLGTQQVAESKLSSAISRFRSWYGVHNGAVVVIDPRNGELLSMVGSADYNSTSKKSEGKVNVAIMPRQMGSSVKPYTYMAAFRDGYTPGSPVPDLAISFGNYKPLDWDKRFAGVMSMRTALNKSRNIPAVYTLYTIGGPRRFIQEVERLGITTLKDKNRYGLSLTLGAGEMTLLEHTNAFSAFANRGVMSNVSVIREVRNIKSEVIFSISQSQHRVYSPEEAYLMNWVLCQMGGRLDKSVGYLYQARGQRICGKTGTSTGPKDLITIGYYPRLVVGVWTGNNDGSLTFGSRGQGWSENVPIIIVRDIMNELVPKYGNEFYSQPSGVATGYVCKNTGALTQRWSGCAKEATVYIKSKRIQLAKSLYRKKY